MEEVIEDVRRIRPASRYVFFVDDNLGADSAYARALFEALIPLKISWSAQLNIGFAEDEGFLRLAARSGFQMAVCGIENVNRANLESVAKGGINDPRRYRELLVRYRRHGIIVLAGMILGFDTDTEETIAQNLRFMQEEKIPMISLFLLTPFPGTPLFERLDGEGRILTRDWSRYDSYTCVYRPRGIGADRLTQLYWNACRCITTLPSIIRRFSPPPRPAGCGVAAGPACDRPGLRRTTCWCSGRRRIAACLLQSRQMIMEGHALSSPNQYSDATQRVLPLVYCRIKM